MGHPGLLLLRGVASGRIILPYSRRWRWRGTVENVMGKEEKVLQMLNSFNINECPTSRLLTEKEQPQTQTGARDASVSLLKTSWQVNFFLLYFSIIGSWGNVWHFQGFCADVVFFMIFFQSVFNLGFTCYPSHLCVTCVRRIQRKAVSAHFHFC